ncbi:MAG TPA: hypothetical protein DCY93_00300 [Firmicutes bacterium]|nr:hypothetical protein [Bacillota bacterium]
MNKDVLHKQETDNNNRTTQDKTKKPKTIVLTRCPPRNNVPEDLILHGVVAANRADHNQSVEKWG